MGYDFDEVIILSMNYFQALNPFQYSYDDLIEVWLEASFKERFLLYGIHLLLLFVNRHSKGLILSIFRNKLFQSFVLVLDFDLSIGLELLLWLKWVFYYS